MSGTKNNNWKRNLEYRCSIVLIMSMVLTLVPGTSASASEPYEVISDNLLVDPDWAEGHDGWEILADSLKESFGDHEALCSIVYQDVPVEDYMKGKSVKLSGKIATAPEDSSQESIYLSMIMCDEDGYVVDGIADDGSFKYDDYVFEESAQKTYHEIIMDVPSEADYIRVSLEIRKQWIYNTFNFEDLCLEVIEKSASVVPSVIDFNLDLDGAATWNGHKYQVVRDKNMNWEDAQKYCESLGGYLVTINSETEQAFLENYLGIVEADGKYMIGLNRRLNDLQTWVTGEPVEYTNWGYGEPDQPSQQTVIMTTKEIGHDGGSYHILPYQWDDDRDGRYSFICEWGDTDSSNNAVTSALSVIDAEAYDEQYGTSHASEGSGCLGYIDNGDWTCYQEIDFESGVSSFMVNASSKTNGGTIELHLDNLTGELIGSVDITNTGGWDVWQDFLCSVSGANGIHDLYLVFTGQNSGYLMDVNYFQFYADQVGPGPQPVTGKAGSVPDSEDVRTLVQRGKAYYNGTAQNGYDRDKAREDFQEAAQAGDGEAWNYLGNLEMNSTDLDRYGQAMEYYTKAYECGYGPGLVGQAMLYEDGLGVEQDFAKALELYTQAAEEGYVEGYCGLGNLYWHGNGVVQDEMAALEYYKMALESEDYIWRNFARCQIARMYLQDIPGIGPDHSSAYDWYMEAANEGYGFGFIGIGNMYYSGNGVDKDLQEAFEWYKRAAAHGNPEGMYSVGFMLEYGQGVDQDYEQALKYYLQAADLGDEDAMYRAGRIYANLDGEYGSTSTPAKAWDWLSLALHFTEDQELIDFIHEILPYVRPGY